MHDEYGPNGEFYNRLHGEKYRLDGEDFREATNRNASALSDDDKHFKAIRGIALQMRFMYAGRIQAAAGAPHQITPFNCLSGDTEIITTSGNKSLSSLSGRDVKLVDANGEWVNCHVYSHGVQDTKVVKLTNGRKYLTVEATTDHEWVVEGEDTRVRTSDLRRNMRIPHTRVHTTRDTNAQIHGLIYGDGTHKPDGGFQLRVCSYKDETHALLDTMVDLPYSTPKSSNGDRHYYFYGDNAFCDMKALPCGETSTSDYIAGFIQGLFLADGCYSTKPEFIISGTKRLLDWLKKYGPKAGFYVSGSSKLASITNYGHRNEGCFNIRFDLRSVHQEDMLRGTSTHEGLTTGWRIAKVLPGKRQEVFCPSVPTTRSFVLSCGAVMGNCFASGTFHDSFAGIMQRATDTAQTMRMGGGIGHDVSPLRPKGELIKGVNSRTDGPLAFLPIFDAVSGATSSAGRRRGAQMCMMRIDHPDIEAYIRLKQRLGYLEGFNLSVAVTDEFMECLRDGKPFDLRWGGKVYETIDPSALWEMLMRSTWDWGDPGVFFIDTVNRMNNLWYCETISTSNPCVTGDTPILTQDGWCDIKSRVGKVTTIWDGHGWEAVTPRVTGTNKHTMDVSFSDGSSLSCTDNHRFKLSDGRIVEADGLSIGDKLEKFEFPTAEWGSEYDTKLAYTQGFFSGDGSTETGRDRNSIWLYGTKRRLAEHLVYARSVDCAGGRTFLTMVKDEPWDKKYVPTEHSTSVRLAWLAGLCDSDGHTQRKKPTDWPTIGVSSVDRGFLMSVKMLCHSLGLDASLRDMKDAEIKLMPDGKGGKKLYPTQKSYRLLITPYSVSKLAGMGLPVKRLDIMSDKNSCRKYYVKVEGISGGSFAKEVFCFTNKATGKGVFGCVSTPQCGEQPLPPHGACLLGSHNLTKYLIKDGSGPYGYSFDWDQFRADIPHIVRAVDNVIDQSKFPLPEQEDEAKSKRRMGLGITGLANAGEALGYTYGSIPFLTFEEQVLTVLRDTAYMASSELAREKGSFPLFDADKFLAGENIKKLPEYIKDHIRKHGIRNSHLTSIAPTGTISLCSDNCSSGIEPVFYYTGDRTVRMETGIETVHTEDYGYKYLGVRGKLAENVTAQEHIAVLTVASDLVDSAVSKTCNVDSTMAWDDFKDIYIHAWENGCKGCTTFNKDGKKMGLLMSKDNDVDPACTIDPVTGEKDCGS